jgi:hypothetical protein
MDEITVAHVAVYVSSVLALLFVTASMLLTTLKPNWRGTGPMFMLIGVLMSQIAFHLVGAIFARMWWALTLTPALVLVTLHLLNVHRAAYREQPAALDRWLLRWLHRKAGIKPLQTLETLRAEYAQTILDDAKYDPRLNAALDDQSAAIVQTLTQRRETLTVDDVTSFANVWVSRLSDPDHKPMRRVYRGYSTEMLVLAAACRTAERL